VVVGGIQTRYYPLCITSLFFVLSTQVSIPRVKLGDFAWVLCTSVVILSRKQTSYQLVGGDRALSMYNFCSLYLGLR
jgi:hypothetical protein